MRQKKNLIRRGELYELVWSKPMTTLSKEYGISDVGLGKICKKLNIPKPESGHWAKIAAGKIVKPEVLPLLKNGESDTYELRPEDNSKIDLPDEIIELIEQERNPDKKIIVPEKYIRYHKMISSIPKEPVSKYDKQNPKYSAIRNNFDIRVGDISFNRALRIFDTLIKALEQRGFEIIIKRGDRSKNTYVKINGTELQITMTEKLKQIISPKYDPSKSWSTKYENVPSGILKLEINEVYYPYEADIKAVRDTQTLKLEERLNEFIIALLKGSVAKNKREEYFENERIKNQKIQEERQALLQEIKNEKKKLEEFMNNIQKYYQCYQMRLYIKAFEENYIMNNGKIAENSETENWIKWAIDHADRIDPFKVSPPSILDKVEEFSRWELE